MLMGEVRKHLFLSWIMILAQIRNITRDALSITIRWAMPLCDTYTSEISWLNLGI
jgi:hypothetical protein